MLGRPLKEDGRRDIEERSLDGDKQQGFVREEWVTPYHRRGWCRKGHHVKQPAGCPRKEQRLEVTPLLLPVLPRQVAASRSTPMAVGTHISAATPGTDWDSPLPTGMKA